MNLYSADLHLGHFNVIKHDGRPYSSVEEMNNALIRNHNEMVSNSDDIYWGGDLFFREKNPEQYLKRLNGIKHLVIGNHDKYWLKDKELRKYFVEISDILHVKDGDKTIAMCHYPMVEWDGYYRGTWHIYAHIHNNLNEAYEIMRHKEKALNAGCMLTEYRPVTFEELVEYNRIFRGDK